MLVTKEKIVELKETLKPHYPIMLKDIEETFEINEKNYGEKSSFNFANGYGFHIFLVSNLEKYYTTIKEQDLLNLYPLEIEDKVQEYKNKIYLRQLFITGSDSGIVIYLML